jgi:hypothetical protein
MWGADGAPIVNAIRELGPGIWDASTGKVVNGVLLMTPTSRA